MLNIVIILIIPWYSDVIVELSREIVLFGSEVLNSLWVTLLEQLRINGIIVKEVFHIIICDKPISQYAYMLNAFMSL